MARTETRHRLPREILQGLMTTTVLPPCRYMCPSPEVGSASLALGLLTSSDETEIRMGQESDMHSAKGKELSKDRLNASSFDN